MKLLLDVILTWSWQLTSLRCRWRVSKCPLRLWSGAATKALWAVCWLACTAAESDFAVSGGHASEASMCYGMLWHSPCRICIIYIYTYVWVWVCVINILMFLFLAFKWLDSLRREFTACSVAEGSAVVFCSQDAQCHSIDSMCNSKIGRAWSMLFVQLGRWLRAVCRVWPRTSHGRHISRLLATIFTSAASLTANAKNCAVVLGGDGRYGRI